MFKGIQWFIERLVERLIPIIATSFSSTVQTLHALGQAEQQSQLEEAARRYEADGKPEIAAALRRRAVELTSDNPASQGVDIYQNIAADTDRLLPVRTLIRSWCGQEPTDLRNEIIELRKEVARVADLLGKALETLRRYDLTREANRIDRAFREVGLAGEGRAR